MAHDTHHTCMNKTFPRALKVFYFSLVCVGYQRGLKGLVALVLREPTCSLGSGLIIANNSYHLLRASCTKHYVMNSLIVLLSSHKSSVK